MSGRKNHGAHEDWNVLDLDDELRTLAAPHSTWDLEKAADLVGRITHLGNVAEPGSLAGEISRWSAYYWGTVHTMCLIELCEGRAPHRHPRWLWWLLTAGRTERRAERAARDRLIDRAVRANVIVGLFGEAMHDDAADGGQR
jgi:hypothetical protein